MSARTGKKIAIIGLGHSQKFAPRSDPKWEKWCLAWDSQYFAGDRLFDCHDLDWLEESESQGRLPPLYFPRLKSGELGEVWMREAYFPHARRYPLEEVIETLGRDYFESSIAFMFALALHENLVHAMNTEIGLWGVHMAAQSEYAYQRPNMEWLLGLAQGMGFKVTLPDSARLLTFNGGKPKPTREGRKELRYSQWESHGDN